MFKRGEKVVYPRHGAGKVEQITTENVGDQTLKYYKIKFFNSPVTVSVPIEKAAELGLRPPLSRASTRKALRELNKRIRINKKTLVTLDNISREKLNSGRLEDAIELVNLLRSLAKQKEEENKNFSYSYSDRLEVASEFIKSEIVLVLGKNALKRHEI
ncbi:MAG: CarD family transcriptional regulator [Candidatus Dojkabacteria bacterium]|jgi:CarD family transcriptional regulator|nr:CarD family transcriptional regulator [Candidatus Dojkabacteria bacterium]